MDGFNPQAQFILALTGNKFTSSDRLLPVTGRDISPSTQLLTQKRRVESVFIDSVRENLMPHSAVRNIL